MKIAMIAPPWLSLYPGCYYGIENVVHNLTSALHESGHEVVLFTVCGSTTPATKRYWYHKEDQYQHIHRPWYQALPIISAHLLYSLNIIRESGDFDIIHDHNSFTGPAMLAFAGDNLPPVLHTLHEPFTNIKQVNNGLPDNRMLFEEVQCAKNLYFTGVSKSQLSTLPKRLAKHTLDVVHNGINLSDYIFSNKKKDYFLSVSRVAPDKGQAIAAKLCYKLGEKFKFAGTIGGDISSKRQLTQQLKSKSATSNVDLIYFRDKIMPYLAPKQIEYLGTVFGEKKMKLLAGAKAFLAPITWEEPFGIAVIDALACGTPVVAFRRGAFSEIIEHGKNGFLADTEAEFMHYMKRVDEIDPAYCRASVEKHFSSNIMAKTYVERYQEVIRRSNSPQSAAC